MHSPLHSRLRIMAGIALICSSAVYADTVILNDGRILTGSILSSSGSRIHIVQDSGEPRDIPLSEISEIRGSRIGIDFSRRTQATRPSAKASQIKNPPKPLPPEPPQALQPVPRKNDSPDAKPKKAQSATIRDAADPLARLQQDVNAFAALVQKDKALHARCGKCDGKGVHTGKLCPQCSGDGNVFKVDSWKKLPPRSVRAFTQQVDVLLADLDAVDQTLGAYHLSQRLGAILMPPPVVAAIQQNPEEWRADAPRLFEWCMKFAERTEGLSHRLNAFDVRCDMLDNQVRLAFRHVGGTRAARIGVFDKDNTLIPFDEQKEGVYTIRASLLKSEPARGVAELRTRIAHVDDTYGRLASCVLIWSADGNAFYAQQCGLASTGQTTLVSAPCKVCMSTGAVPGAKCRKCDGKGNLASGNNPSNLVIRRCDACGGTGRQQQTCSACGGRGLFTTTMPADDIYLHDPTPVGADDPRMNRLPPGEKKITKSKAAARPVERSREEQEASRREVEEWVAKQQAKTSSSARRICSRCGGTGFITTVVQGGGKFSNLAGDGTQHQCPTCKGTGYVH